jgi:diacylglycerol O-acyltransferase
MGELTQTATGLQTLTANESLLWHAEAVRGQFHPWFGALLVLGREPDEAAFERALGGAIDKVARLRHHVGTTGFGVGLPQWRAADLVDVRYHLRRLRLQSDSDLTSALGALSVIAALPMDRSRPLWECYVLGPLIGGRSVCLLKFHGALIDSIEVADVIGVLGSEGRAKRASRTRPAAPRGVVGAGFDLARDGLRRSWNFARGAAGVSAGALRHPLRSLESAWRGARSLPDAVTEAAELVAKELEGVTVTRGIRSFDVLSVPVAALEATARPLGVSPEDLMLAALTAGLRALRPPVTRRTIETSCIARLRLEAGNGDRGALRSVLGTLPLPIGERREARRLAMIRDARRAMCAEDGAAGLSPWLSHAMGVLPRTASGWVVGLGLGRQNAGFFDAGAIDTWGTVAGADIEAAYAFADLAEAATLTTTVLRSGPLVHVGIAGDARLPTDSRSFHGLFDTAFEEMADLAARFARGGKRYAGGVAADIEA